MTKNSFVAEVTFNVEGSVWLIITFHALVCYTGLNCIMTTIFCNIIFDYLNVHSSVSLDFFCIDN